MNPPSLIRYDQPSDARPLIEQCIARFGWAPEHNCDYFFHSEEPELRNVFFTTPEGWGLFAQVSDDYWQWLGEPLAPEADRGALMAAFTAHAFSFPATEKISGELTTNTRKDLIASMPEGVRARSVAETLYWPVIDLRVFDPTYQGSRFKSLRNVKNRFSRDHAFQIVNAAEVDPKLLHVIVDTWTRDRTASHRAYPGAYHQLIDESFAGTYAAQVLVVDGKPEGFNAGWVIPNSKTYYLAVSLHSYAHWGLGEMIMMSGIEFLKSRGFEAVDLGGSDQKLLAFKQQFGDISTYNMHRFSLVRG